LHRLVVVAPSLRGRWPDKAAEESNAENLLIVQDPPDLVQKYVANYEAHRAHSPVYEPATGTEGESEKRGAAADNGDAGVQFVGSRDSDVYHYPSCRDVQKIRPENLVRHKAAPAGKRLHKGCRR
jgi:hypothetical protein